MALLTAEDVLNKAFSKTKYREGFDQDEVDDFLDEVANAISALTAERDELHTRLAQYQAGGVPVAPASVPTQVAGSAMGAPSASADLLAAATDPNPPSATTMLSMAQKLHDDYLHAGESERDRIVDEGKAKAEAIVQQAETDARIRMQSLETDRADLERRIDDLRRFERDYRGHLRNYLENLLGDLEHNSARGEVAAPGAASPVAVTMPPMFGSAFAEEPAGGRHDSVVDDFAGHSAQPEPFVPVMPSEPFVPVAQPEPFAPTAQPEPYVPVAQPEAFRAVQPSEPFVPVAQPEAAPRHTDVSQPGGFTSSDETLPPFPGASQMASPFGVPFTDSDPFSPVAPSAQPHSPVVDPQVRAGIEEPKGDEETPRWNF